MALDQLVKAAQKAPMLTAEEEAEYGRRWINDRDPKALQMLVESHVRLLFGLARRYASFGIPYPDLVQEGSLGLIRAAELFDPDKGVRFSTYATLWIRSTIRDFVARNLSVVRGAAARSAAAARQSDSATDPLTSGREGGSKRLARRSVVSDFSLNAPMGAEEDQEWQDNLVDEGPTPEEVVISGNQSAIRAQRLQEALGALSERDRMIVQRRHLTEDPSTLAELGVELGISKERVRQLEKRSLDRLQRMLSGEQHQLMGTI